MASQHHPPGLHGDLKRKRSPSHDTLHHASAPLQKAAKTHNHLQINYLARQLTKDLPLITNDDTLPNILSLLGDYQGVLDRHESMACNLGARPLGPILIKRFERLFDGPPRVLKNHGKDNTTVTWLDVVEFARNKPDQFQLGQMSEGLSVCQFYTKQCRVQISEEDFVLISSGIPQKMIPPQPIIEDEEKELGTIDILEKNLAQMCQLADQVAARTRQLNHRLKGRKQAILDRRATASPVPPMRSASPSNVALMNGGGGGGGGAAPLSNMPQIHSSQTSPSGFVAVNARPHPESAGNGPSSTTRHDLLSKFHTMSERRPSSHPPPNSSADTRQPSIPAGAVSHPSTPVSHLTKPPPKPVEGAQQNMPRPPHVIENELHSMLNSPVPIPGTPSNLLPAPSQRNSQPLEKDDGGPFKTDMVHKMEILAKGERILPPCDRCRRLHMDCLKNLTACVGCTKKHAKCSWKEVREVELRGGFAHPPASNSNVHSENSDHDSGDRASTASPMLTPPHHGPHSPQHVVHQPAQHQAEVPSHPTHLSTEPPVQQHHSHYDLAHNTRIPPSRNSPPPESDRVRERNAETQSQEAANSGLVHSSVNGNHTRLGGSESKSTEFHQPVAA